MVEEARRRRRDEAATPDASGELGVEPLGEAFVDATTAAILREVAPPAKVIPLRRRRARVAALAGAALAMAAAAMVMLWPAGPGSGLPAYEVTVQGGARVVRGPSTAPALSRFAPGTQAVILVRPASPVEDEPQFRVVARQRDAVRELRGVTQISPEGALRLEIDLHGALGDMPGVWSLEIEIQGPESEAMQRVSMDVAIGEADASKSTPDR